MDVQNVAKNRGLIALAACAYQDYALFLLRNICDGNKLHLICFFVRWLPLWTPKSPNTGIV